MDARKILFPTDLSDSSDAARELATALARDTGATLIIAHVVEPAPHSADFGFGGQGAEAVDDAVSKEQLEKVLPTDPNVRATHCLLHGSPVQEIVKYAEDEDVDMIVIGTHGRRGLFRVLMGSVAEGVVRKADCPVLTIKMPSRVADETPD